MKPWDILAFGAVAVDDLLYVENYPEPGSKIHVAERRREGGGLAGTAMCAASKLGARIAWAGVLGEDELSVFSLADLRRYGVDCTMVLSREDARPHYSVIIVNRVSGARTILALHDGVQEFPASHVNEELIHSCEVLFVDHHGMETSIKAAHLARRLQIPVVADIERLTDGLDELLPLIDHLIVSYDFARELTGEETPPNIARSLGQNRICGAVTHGENGCWFAARGAILHQAAFQVPVVDTTGCGDVFHGAYAACVASGETIADSILTATACAALKAQYPGGRSGIPSRETVRKFLM
jgi:ribokinase